MHTALKTLIFHATTHKFSNKYSQCLRYRKNKINEQSYKECTYTYIFLPLSANPVLPCT